MVFGQMQCRLYKIHISILAIYTVPKGVCIQLSPSWIFLSLVIMKFLKKLRNIVVSSALEPCNIMSVQEFWIGMFSIEVVFECNNNLCVQFHILLHMFFVTSWKQLKQGHKVKGCLRNTPLWDWQGVLLPFKVRGRYVGKIVIKQIIWFDKIPKYLCALCIRPWK